MKGNKKWVAAAYAAAFTAAFSMNAYADGHWEQNASGYWWQEDNGTYLKNGWKWLDGNRDGVAECYYFDANGYRFTGAIKLDKYTYYFHPESGKLCKGYAGLYRIGDNSNDYYFFLNSKKGRVAVNTWVKSKGKYYYAGADGKIQLGTIKVKGKLYHVTPKGRMTSYGRIIL